MWPSRRGWALVALAFLLYVFANQTQVGWLYVAAALVGGLWLAALGWPSRQLRGLHAQRLINEAPPTADLELFAGQLLRFTIQLTNPAPWPVLQIRGEEVCPVAAPADRAQPFFVAALAGRATVALPYTVTAYRRGAFSFPPLALRTSAPFGLRRATRLLPVPTNLLIFPAYRPLRHLALFDRTPAAQSVQPRPGPAGEFIGVRDYRPGDARRQVHWRATARAGRLIVKEFAEETQPGLTIALDLRATAALPMPASDSSLELAIQAAASLAHFALGQSLPVQISTNSVAWPAPAGALRWWAMLNYLARVEAAGDESFASCLGHLPAQAFVVALCPSPDLTVIDPLAALRRRGVGVMAVVIDPRPYVPDDLEKHTITQRCLNALRAEEIPTCLLRPEEAWEETLADCG